MSCENNPNKAGRAAKASGITKTQSKSAYLAPTVEEINDNGKSSRNG